MIMEQRSSLLNLSSNGSASSQVLTRPFFNPVANQEDADPRALPNVMSGSINQAFGTRLQGAESNLRFNSLEPGGIGFGFQALAGVRWLQLQEHFVTADTAHDLPTGSVNANNYFISDSFGAFNSIFAPQAGFGASWAQKDLVFDVIAKVAAGGNWETVRIDGLTTITSQTTGQVVSGRQGLYAQPSNIGSHNHTTFSLIPELDVNLTWIIIPAVRLKVGYALLGLCHVVRPGNEIDRTVNIQPLLAPTQIGVARPTFQGFNQTSFLLNGLNFGLEFAF
jgi:hypothetical protein